MCCVCRFRETTFELLGGVTELNFNMLKWGDDEVVQLAVVLPLCAKLTELKLLGNQVGARGAAALAGAIKGNGALKVLWLQISMREAAQWELRRSHVAQRIAPSLRMTDQHCRY